MGKQTWSASLILFFLWFVTPISGATNQMDVPWHMFQGNAAHNGYVTVSLDAEVFEEKWQHNFSAPLNPVSAADGKVFVTLNTGVFEDAQFIILDGEDGTELFRENYGTVNSASPPSFGYGNVYLQTNFHFYDNGSSYLHGHQANETGVEVFRSTFSAQFYTYAAPTVYDGCVYANTGSHSGISSFYAIDGGNHAAGERVWKWENNEMLPYSQLMPAVDDKHVYVYLGGGSNGYPAAALYVIDRITGDERYRIEDPVFSPSDDQMNSAPVVGELNDILVIQNGRLISFDLLQQRIRWEVKSHFSGQPSVCKGVIYAIDYGLLSAWDQVTGNPLWSINDLGEQLEGTLIITDTHIFAGNSNGTYGIDLETKESFLLHESGGHLALGNDSLYIASSNGLLTAIRLAGNSPSLEPPIAHAGPDRISSDDVTLDAGESWDPDGEILSYVWQIEPKVDEMTEPDNLLSKKKGRMVEGKTPTLSDLEPGFYNVTLYVTDNDGLTAEDTLLLAIAGECQRPQPNAAFDIKRFRINKYKRWNWTTASFYSMIDLPELEFSRRDRAKAAVTIEIDLPNGESLVLRDEIRLKVRNSKYRLKLYK